MDVSGTRDPAAAGAASRTDLYDIRRAWRSGWQRFVFPAVWLVYLAETVRDVGRYSTGAAQAAGYAIIAVFAVCYLLALPVSWAGPRRLPARFWVLYGTCIALTVAETFLAREGAFVLLTYVGVLTVSARRTRGLWAVAVFALAAAVVPALVPSWHDGVDWGDGFSIVLVAMAMYGFFFVIESNRQLADARAEVARLAAENERTRIARDLHDLLGHSLTTITVKAGLARRLGERGDPERAVAEIAEVETLARRTLDDVRAAVSMHREVTLAGELATAREVLRASGVTADLPPSVAETAPELSELFGWVLREGVTNVVRHAHADHVRVTVGPRFIEIADDGAGTVPRRCSGNGLRGLDERVTGHGGTLRAEGTEPGFRLRAEVPEPASPEFVAAP